MIFNQTNQQINHKLTIEAVDSLELQIFNLERSTEQTEEFKAEERTTYKSKMIRDATKPLKTVLKHLKNERDLIEVDFLY